MYKHIYLSMCLYRLLSESLGQRVNGGSWMLDVGSRRSLRQPPSESNATGHKYTQAHTHTRQW